MITTRTKTMTAALLAAAGLAAAGPVQSALAFNSPPLVLQASTTGTAKLAAKGAAVDVPITYTCAGTRTMYTNIQVTQAVGRRTATGNGWADLPCNGQTINTTIRVNSSGAASFGTGSAAVSIYVDGYGCTNTGCTYGHDTFTSTVKITK